MSDKEPNFFILGAPKCGTTSMSGWLDAHPEVYISPVKEPHYYSTDLRNRSVTSSKRYHALFAGVSSVHRAVGEASTWYLYSRDAVPAIERAHPAARFIVMTRDPVEMVISLHHHNLRVLHENEPSLEVAWRLQAERAAGRSIPITCAEPSFLQYLDACALGSQLYRLYAHVPRERVLHVSMTALKHDPGAAFRSVLAFLGVPNDGRNNFSPANEARGYRSRTAQQFLRWGGRIRMALGFQKGLGLSRLNERPFPKQAISDNFRKELERTFTDEKQLLDKLSC